MDQDMGAPIIPRSPHGMTPYIPVAVSDTRTGQAGRQTLTKKEEVVS